MNSNKDTIIAWIDTETTGVDIGVCDIWQLACILEKNGIIIAQENFVMRPHTDYISPEALNLQENEITVEYLMSLPDPNIVMREFKYFLGDYVDQYDRSDKLVPAGYKINFDLDFLRAAFHKVGDKYFGSWFFTSPIHVESDVGRRVANGLRLKDYKLATVCKAFGIELTAHDALSDILATRELYYKLKDQRIANPE